MQKYQQMSLYVYIIIINTILMEFNTPKCIGGKDCYLVCQTKNCSGIPFICVDGCECQQAHKQCDTNVRWKIFKQLFSKKLIQTSVQTKNYLKQVDEIYKSILKQIQVSYNQMKNLQYTFGLNQIQTDIFTKLRQDRVGQLSGNMISQIRLKSQKSQITIIDGNIVESKKLIDKQTQILLIMLSDLTQEKQMLPFKSNLIKDIETISPFFTKKIKQCRLLYRASENNFQANKFHEKCDGKQHTIVILKTEFGNIIGGYTPLKWDKSKHGQYQIDNSMQSFIFSLTYKHKLSLIKGKQGNAIYHNNSWGPAFGGGNDLWIGEKANQNKNNGVYPGYTYNYNNEYNYNHQQSWYKFCGQSTGLSFKIQQWQVFSILFA